MYPGSSWRYLVWHFMLLYFPFFSISPQFSFPKLFGSCVFQRHVPDDVTLTQVMLSLNQHHVWDPSTLFKPINQRVSLCFLANLCTKCHSDSVSIETSELFSWSLHSSQVFPRGNNTWSRQELIFMGSRLIKEKKTNKWKWSIHLSFNYIHHSRIRRSCTEGELKETLGHTNFFTSTMVQYGLGERDCEFPRLDHYISQKTPEGWYPPSIPFNPMFNEIKVNLNSVSAI